VRLNISEERAAMLVFSFGVVLTSLVFSAENISSRVNCNHFDLIYKNIILNLLKRLVKGMKKNYKGEVAIIFLRKMT